MEVENSGMETYWGWQRRGRAQGLVLYNGRAEARPVVVDRMDARAVVLPIASALSLGVFLLLGAGTSFE